MDLTPIVFGIVLCGVLGVGLLLWLYSYIKREILKHRPMSKDFLGIYGGAHKGISNDDMKKIEAHYLEIRNQLPAKAQSRIDDSFWLFKAFGRLLLALWAIGFLCVVYEIAKGMRSAGLVSF